VSGENSGQEGPISSRKKDDADREAASRVKDDVWPGYQALPTTEFAGLAGPGIASNFT